MVTTWKNQLAAFILHLWKSCEVFMVYHQILYSSIIKLEIQRIQKFFFFFFQRTFIDHLLCICFWELGHSRTEQNLCSQETWDMWVSNTDKFHDLLELSFPFLSPLQFRWKQIIPNDTDNRLYTPFHGSCRLNHP